MVRVISRLSVSSILPEDGNVASLLPTSEELVQLNANPKLDNLRRARGAKNPKGRKRS